MQLTTKRKMARKSTLRSTKTMKMMMMEKRMTVALEMSLLKTTWMREINADVLILSEVKYLDPLQMNTRIQPKI